MVRMLLLLGTFLALSSAERLQSINFGGRHHGNRKSSSGATAVVVAEEVGGGFPPICDKAIVEETCSLVSADNGASTILPSDLKETLSATDKSMGLLWALLDMTGAEESVACETFCDSVATALTSQNDCPPTSDVGCYFASDGKKRCDLDLRPKAVEDAGRTTEDLPDFDPNEHPQYSPVKVDSKKPPEFIDYDPQELLRRVANLFRIYPSLWRASFHDGEKTLDSGGASFAESVGAGAENGSAITTDNSTQYPVQFPGQQPHYPGQFGGRPMVIVRPQQQGGQQPIRHMPTNQRPGHIQAQHHLQQQGAAQNGGQVKNLPPDAPSWRQDVEKVALKAQTYVSTAIREFRAGRTGKHLKKWFGEGCPQSHACRERVQMVLNSIAAVLANVDFVYPGDDCGWTTYAFVFPEGPEARDRRGRFLFHLCWLYMKSSTSVQIETLVHEGSHHAFAYTDDVEFESSIFGNLGKRTSYGRGTCTSLAQYEPEKAINNADNFCYYVQDITDA